MENIQFLGLNLIVWIALIIAVIIIAIGFIIFLTKKKNKRIAQEKVMRSENLLSALGNSENILSIEAKESRINLSLKDYSLIDEAKLKELGVSSIVKTTKKITLVVGHSASQEIVDFIKDHQN